MALQRVETDAIEDDAVTTAKIAPNAIAAADIAADAITNVKVAAGAAIAVAKISGLGTAAALNVGTSANNVVQLDGSARLPAVSGANLTGITTDTSAMENNIAILAFKTQSSNNLAKFNLVDQVIDEYKDGTGVTFSTASQVGSTATDGYLATVYTANVDTSITLNGSNYTTYMETRANNGIVSRVDDFDFSSNTDEVTAPGSYDEAYMYGTATSQINAWTGSMNGQNFIYETKTAYTFAPNGTASMTWRDGAGTGPIKIYGVSSGFVGTELVQLAASHNGAYPTTFSQTISNSTFFPAFTISFVTVASNSSRAWNSVSIAGTMRTSSSEANAAGTATSTANTALTAPTTGDICMLMENFAGTTTLNTDLKAFVSRNGGTGWDQATLVDKGSWGTNKKILVANNVAFSNSASGTDMRYKIEWANQASGSKETRVHATSLAWA